MLFSDHWLSKLQTYSLKTCKAIQGESVCEKLILTTRPSFPSACCRTLTPEEWDQITQYNKDRAEAEMKAASDLREAMALTIAQVNHMASYWLLGRLLMEKIHYCML